MKFNITNFKSKLSYKEDNNVTFINENYIIKNNKEEPLNVYLRVTSFSGYGFAHHVYGTFVVPRLICEGSYHRNFNEFKMDVKYPAPKSIKEDRRVVCKKNDLTSRFDSIHDLIRVAEEQFNLIFGEPWVLQSYDNVFTKDKQTWEETKKTLIYIYGEENGL